jgi:tetratricopeptide (TPR) repeat protein
MSDYKVARLEEIEEQSDGRAPWRPVRHHFGITSFGVNAWTGHAAGDRIINEHDEADEGEEELYVVQSGRARFDVGGDTVDAPAGTYVFVPPGVKRTAFAEEPQTTIIVVGGEPGKAYRPTGWEAWQPINPLYEEGRYAEAAAAGRAVALEQPLPNLLYNLACCESLAGETDQAIEHLGQAIAGYEDFRGYAGKDSDFDPIREDPRFQELLG